MIVLREKVLNGDIIPAWRRRRLSGRLSLPAILRKKRSRLAGWPEKIVEEGIAGFPSASKRGSINATPGTRVPLATLQGALVYPEITCQVKGLAHDDEFSSNSLHDARTGYCRVDT